jgi:hypothetical protein
MSFDIKSGKHLGVVRSWMQHKAKNGSDVTWGSNEPLQILGSLTPDVMEHLAQDIADASVSEVLADVSRLSHIAERAEQTLKLIFPTEKNQMLVDAYASVSWDLLMLKNEIAKISEKKDVAP